MQMFLVALIDLLNEPEPCSIDIQKSHAYSEICVGVALFPFITTCLVLGASFDAAEGYQARVHDENIDMRFDAGDNIDGISIIDIIHSERAQYCIVNFEDKRENNWEDEDQEDEGSQNGRRQLTERRIVKGMTPLPASSYLWGYYGQYDQKD